MKYIETITELADLMTDIDHVDSKCGEGKMSMRAFIAATLSYMPGWMRFFTVVMAKDEHYWVKYHHWTGPVYFNVIRSFHHFVVWAMIRTAVR